MKVFIRAHRKGDGFIGRFIAWFTFGEYKHISMVFASGNIIYGFQSNGAKGVHFFDTETIGAENADTFELPITSEQGIKMFRLAKTLVGSKYDYAGIWGFVRRAKRENPFKYFCSEVAAWLGVQVNFWILNRDPYSISPTAYASSPLLIPRPDLNV